MSIDLAKQRVNTIGNIINEYGSRLSNFIRSRVSNPSDAEDILQEVWYQLSRVSASNPIEQVSAWLFRVARNKVTDNYRKKKPELIDDFGYENEEGESFFRELLITEDDDPETELFKQMFWEELFEALDELPQNQREVFVWNELEDETFQQISDRTGVKIKTLISRKRYAVKFLRTRLQEMYDDLLNY
ncbi:MAG: sigma-70 family RNA polymerase sigma factor [Bacteroidota bacterium]